MPGPGGGGHGGGFGGGGSFRGGGFGGGYRPPRPGFFFMPFWGGGCLGALFAPMICMVLAIVMIIGLIGGGLATLFRGGNVVYNEEKFHEYANRQYATIYDPSSATYEDNVLIVFLIYNEGEEYNNYKAIGWVGDNLKTEVNVLFGGDGSALAYAMRSSVNTNSYRYSLGSNLTQMTETMQAGISSMNLETAYRTQKAEKHEAGKIYNRSNSDIQFNEGTVNDALKNFTDSTDISMSIVIADAKDVFGKSLNTSAILALLLCIILIVYAVVAIVRYVKRRKGNADSWR